MKKEQLISFIEKYSLKGNIQSVNWEVTDKNIKTKSMSDCKGVVAYVSLNTSTNLDDSKVSILDSSKLQKMLGVLEDDVNVTYVKNSQVDDRITALNFSSGKSNISFVTADESTISEVPVIDSDEIGEFGLHIKLTDEFVSKYNKAVSALSEIDSFALVNKNNKIKLIVGYSETLNTNKISLDVTPVENHGDLAQTVIFNAKFLKDIFACNEITEDSTLKIYSDEDGGLAFVSFKDDSYESEYYLNDLSDNG